jgi:hypothetical protein
VLRTALGVMPRAIPQTSDAYNPTAVESLRIDLKTANTFIRLASRSKVASETKTRNQANARRAYDAVLHMCKQLTLTNADVQDIDKGLKRLKSALQRLGKTF